MWECSTCDEQVDDDLDVCWNCQTGKDGSSSEAYFRKELVPRELQTMRERMSQQTDSDLLGVANLDPNEYRQDGIDLARAELGRRGVIPKTYGSGSKPSIGRIEPTKLQESDGDHGGLQAIQSGAAKERAAMGTNADNS